VLKRDSIPIPGCFESVKKIFNTNTAGWFESVTKRSNTNTRLV
jgi:hypothetical protein